jgi:hypothetical protein
MATTPAAIAPPSAVGTPEFDREVQDLVKYLHYSLAKQEPEPDCPNHSEDLTDDDFTEAATALIGPFSKAIEGYYDR